MAIFTQEDEILLQLIQTGWSVRGSIDDLLELEKSPKYSKLRAEIKVVNKGNDTYNIIGRLYVPSIEHVLGVDRTDSKPGILDHLRRITFGIFEAYFNGFTDIPHIKEIHEKYKLN